MSENHSSDRRGSASQPTPDPNLNPTAPPIEPLGPPPSAPRPRHRTIDFGNHPPARPGEFPPPQVNGSYGPVLGPAQLINNGRPPPQFNNGPGPAHFIDGGPGPALFNNGGPAHFNGGPGPALFNNGGPTHFNGGPSPAHFNSGPGPAHFNGGPGPAHFNGGPGPAHFNGDPGPAHFNGGPGPAHFNGGPSPAYFSNGPGPTWFNNGPSPHHHIGGPVQPHQNMMNGAPRPSHRAPHFTNGAQMVPPNSNGAPGNFPPPNGHFNGGPGYFPLPSDNFSLDGAFDPMQPPQPSQNNGFSGFPTNFDNNMMPSGDMMVRNAAGPAGGFQNNFIEPIYSTGAGEAHFPIVFDNSIGVGRSGFDNTFFGSRKYGFDIDNDPPFIDLTGTLLHADRGVVKIKNIPYNLTGAEVVQFIQKQLLQQGGIDHSSNFPVHIIMERPTAKTMDCFVEVDTREVAHACVQRHDHLVQSSRPPKLGTRMVDIEESSQGQLMRELFPRTKCVRWDLDTGLPEQFKNTDIFSGGFRGFLTTEEHAGLVRHAEFPNRSPFSQRCLQRTFECMISTLYKFPWYCTFYCTQDRDKIFNTFKSQLQILVNKVAPAGGFRGHNVREVGLDSKLLLDFAYAGVRCPGFSERQKSSIVAAVGHYATGMPVSPLSHYWPFKTLGKPDGVDDQCLAMWLDLLARGATAVRIAGTVLESGEYLTLSSDFQDYITINITSKGSELSFAKLAQLEARLMHLLIEKGWEQWFKDQGIEFEPREIEDDKATVKRLAHFQNQLDAIAETVDNNETERFPDLPTPIEYMQQLLLNSSEDFSPPVGETLIPAPAAPIPHRGPQMFSGTTHEPSPGSGVISMQSRVDVRHSTNTGRPNCKYVNECLARQNLNPESPAFAPSHVQWFQPVATGGHMISFSDPTADSFRPRARSTAVPIRHPQGGSVDFNAISRSVLSTKSPSVTPKNGSALYDPFESPSRRGSVENISNAGDRSASTASAHGISASPAKSYDVQDPVGTPSRRSTSATPKRAVSIDHTIHEENEDEEELGIRGGRRASAPVRRL